MSEKDDILTDKVRELNDGATDRSGNTALILNEKRILTEPFEEDRARQQMAKYSRRGFVVGGAAAVLGVLGWRWMPEETKAHLLRRTFEFNERVSQVFYRPSRLEKEFPASAISPRRVNGDVGLKSEIDPAAWMLTVGAVGEEVVLSLDDIQQLPRTEMITELKCIEGWSVIVHWAGVRFSDFVAKYGPSEPTRYVSMATPDNEYFVGWDIESIMHPQTLLAYEMNGVPLLPEHGAPLRLASPTKYGIKLIKRIGRIEFTNERPRDYWAENGYDWYSGH